MHCVLCIVLCDFENANRSFVNLSVTFFIIKNQLNFELTFFFMTFNIELLSLIIDLVPGLNISEAY